MKTIFENELIRVVVDELDRVTVISKESDMEDTKITIAGFEDGHLSIRSEFCRYHPTDNGFNVWLN